MTYTIAKNWMNGLKLIADNGNTIFCDEIHIVRGITDNEKLLSGYVTIFDNQKILICQLCFSDQIRIEQSLTKDTIDDFVIISNQ